MMLVTRARSPASWAAMLPQKFSAATTSILEVEPPGCTSNVSLKLAGTAQKPYLVCQAAGRPSWAGKYEMAPAGWHRRLPAVLQRLSETATLEELTATLARDVRTLTGFDRVMVYRFDAEWNGEVVAEDRRPDLEPFLGLHYPASDIPAQARELYARNWMRLIPDAGYLRRSEHRELFLSGLRLAAGEET